MSSVNKVIIVGRLGEDPTLRHTTSGKAVGNFSVATSIKSGQAEAGYGKEEVEWHRIVVWDKQAENCEKYLSKGKLCYVEGRLATRKYEKDGVTHYSTEIIAHTVQFLSPREEQRPPQHASQYPRNEAPHSTPQPEMDYMDVPF